MYMILLSFPLFVFSFFWMLLNSSLKKMMSFLCVMWLSLLISCFYLNGNDWSIYYLSFLDNGTPFSSFEFGFVFLFKGLLYFFSDSFGLSILFLYFICFSFLASVLNKYKCNTPVFFAFLILALGFSLVLEQLRQFIACIMVFCSFLNFSYIRRNYLTWVIGASCFHSSALIIIPIYILLKLKKDSYFSIVSLLSFVFIFFGLIVSKPLFNSLADVNFIFSKINYYLSLSAVEIKFGFLNVFDFAFIFLYFFKIKNNVVGGDDSILRIIFIGALIHLLSSSVPLFGRISYYFYFILIFYFSKQSFVFSRYIEASKIYKNSFFVIFILFNLASYFRNPIAPIYFLQMNTNATYLYNGNDGLFWLAQKKLSSSSKLDASR
ncbi:MAG: EpsG family protein [Hafnia sp.]